MQPSRHLTAAYGPRSHNRYACLNVCASFAAPGLVDGNCQTFVDLFYLTAPEAQPSDEVLIAKGIGAFTLTGTPRAFVFSRPHIGFC